MFKNGLVLFDIDGTLNTGIENDEVVQFFLDKNYAVGISTANPSYHPNNLMSFDWMPANLYMFMVNHNFDTFNNVGSNILCGQYNPEIYKYAENFNKDIYTSLGIKKGISLSETAYRYGIYDPKKCFLFDNDPNYLHGCFLYNNNFNVVCAGRPCGKENMSTNTIYNFLHRKTW